MSTDIVLFNPWHARAIFSTLPNPYAPDRMEEFIAAYISPGSVARTLLYDSAPVACGGIVYMGFSRGEAWLLTHPAMWNPGYFPITLWKTLKHQFPSLARSAGFRRVQVTCFDREKHKFFERLGFVRETRDDLMMEYYGPDGEPADLYRRIFI